MARPRYSLIVNENFKKPIKQNKAYHIQRIKYSLQDLKK